jgi:hypothetical protein
MRNEFLSERRGGPEAEIKRTNGPALPLIGKKKIMFRISKVGELNNESSM